jgi:hypothetical protein
MVALSQLLLPILLSAVLVFVCSSLIHMVIKWHNKDYWKLSNEDAVRAAINAGSPAPGQYIIPHCDDPKEFKNPDFQKKFSDGPIAVVYLKAPGLPKMGPQLGGWFLFNVIVSFFAGYVGSATLPVGNEYLKVFQVVGTAGVIAYSLGGVPAAIWMGKPWAVVIKEIVDGLIYGMVMGGTFGWLWPK